MEKVIKGKSNTAIVYAKTLEDVAVEQIKGICDMEAYSNSKIRIMPDAHAGKGCTIGTTMTITNKVCPNLVGVDIGCGVLAVKLREKKIDYDKLDKVIKRRVPSGKNVHNINDVEFISTQPFLQLLTQLKCIDHINVDYAIQSVGTLGGGNHFIEVDRDMSENLWLLIHTGSRHLGVEVATFYQNEAYKARTKIDRAKIVQETIRKLKSENRHNEIEEALKSIKAKNECSKENAWLEGAGFDNYIHDMKLVQKFAKVNRKTIAKVICTTMSLTAVDYIETVHNYIDTENMILRKGAISAQNGENILIPINMRDGTLLCVGKGNSDWNCSAPHGAGRIMSRNKAKQHLSVEQFQKEMSNIYTTTANESTLDESPMAYKPMEEIMEAIKPTVDVVDRLIPVYNFKAGE